MIKITSWIEKTEFGTYSYPFSGNSMDSYNVNTHLPPRKRLLAELRRENSDLDFLPPVPFVSGELGYQLRDVVYSPSSTAQEILEVSMSIALATAEIAVAARHTAMEKAAAAAKAKASARSALLLLDSVARNRKPGKVDKTRVRKRQIPVELLYKTKYPAGEQKGDAELARKLHHAINSSPRISRKKQKNFHNFGKEVLCNGEVNYHEKSTILPVGIRFSNKCTTGKSEKKNIVCPKADILRREEEQSNCCTAKQQRGSKFGLIASDREVRVKRKTMSLSQCDIGDQIDAKTLLSSTNHHS